MFSEFVATPPLIINEDLSKELSVYIEKIQEANQTECPFKYDTISSHLKLFLIACNRLVNNKNTNNPQFIETGKTIVKSFKETVENNFKDWHKVG